MYASTKHITFDIEHTLQILYSVEKIFKRKNRNNMSFELKKCIKYILGKDFMTYLNVKICFDSTTITISGDEKIVDEFTVSIPNSPNKVFGPVIYYMFSELHRCGRMIVHKKDNGTTKYLVHRSNFNKCPLEHPGGHIEYIEVNDITNINDNMNIRVTSGKQYIETILQEINVSAKYPKCLDTNIKNHINKLMQTTLLNTNVVRWMLYGTCREVYEEAGLDVSSYIPCIDLIKLGTKTHYFAVLIDNNIVESGPQDRFKSEVYTSSYISPLTNISFTDKTKHSDPINITVNRDNYQSTWITNVKTVSPNGYDVLCDILNNETKSTDNLTLDEFWYERKNNNTHHAWINSVEMKTYWDQQYRSHIDDMIHSTC